MMSFANAPHVLLSTILAGHPCIVVVDLASKDSETAVVQIVRTDPDGESYIVTAAERLQSAMTRAAEQVKQLAVSVKVASERMQLNRINDIGFYGPINRSGPPIARHRKLKGWQRPTGRRGSAKRRHAAR